MKKAILITISILSTLLFCSVENDKFIFSKKGIGTNSLELNIDIENITEVDGYKKITNHTNNHTIDSGFPELPTYTTFYQLDPGKEYNIEMIIHDSYIIENMKIIPYEDENSNSLLNQNLNFYTSNNQYPESNFHISNRMPSRGIDIVSLEVIPFTYYSDTNSLEVFTNVEILFNEIGDREVNQNSLMKRSRVMDSLLENFVVNYETSSRDEDYQIPSILYICGGSSESNSYFQDLIE